MPQQKRKFVDIDRKIFPIPPNPQTPTQKITNRKTAKQQIIKGLQA